MVSSFNLVIIGGGILGTALSYFASLLNRAGRIAVVEQASKVAFHTSGRNTGKVHAPYLYHPENKRLMAEAAFYGFGMWEEYARERNLPFKRDGVIEVSLDEEGTTTLEKHRRWGLRNGLAEDEIEIVTERQLQKTEPNIRCHCALRVGRDGSTDYAALTSSLMSESVAAGTELLLNRRAVRLIVSGRRESGGDGWAILLDNGKWIYASFVINAAGGQAIDLAHDMGAAKDLTDVHFRGEYWKAPARYRDMTRTSVYSVPEFSEYPFLDPHWIRKVDGSCEVGPNAVPVFSPYGYGRAENVKEFVPKVMEMLGSGARKAVMDRRFQELALGEFISSVSKSAMIERVRRFLPTLDARKFSRKGTAGIRSSVIDSRGKFVPEAVLESGRDSLHILNYNSPGATGALPFAARLLHILAEDGRFGSRGQDAQCGPWRFADIVERML